MRYSGLVLNDVAAAPGVSVSFFTQGCPHHCPGCFNPETWDYNGGKEFTTDILTTIIKGLNANGIERNLCIMGGEPLCENNLFLTRLIVSEVKKASPDTKIYIWTGYLYEDLLGKCDPQVVEILNNTFCLIDGPFNEELKDLTLQMRGSSNQRLIYLN